VLAELTSYGDSFKSHTGLPLGEQTLQHLIVYVTELFRWNDRAALISRGDEPRIVERHIMDSLSLLAFIHETDGISLLDIGSGAGFPGIPLKLAAPGLGLTLVESIHKKQLFLNHIIQKLGLTGACVLGDRAENAPWRADVPEGFDLVTCRATLSLCDLAGIGGAAVRSGGVLVAYKGGRYAAELAQAQDAINRARLQPMAIWESPWGPGRLLVFQR
jgi:16S rRNA (guanine527-N7)-methyltransferase